MNRLCKIFLVIIIVLVMALGIMTYLFIYMKNIATDNFNQSISIAKEVWNANVRIQELENQLSHTNTTVPVNASGEQPNVKFNRNPQNVTIEVLTDTVTRESVEILITDYNEDSYGWGVEFKIQKKVNEEWKNLEYTSDNLYWNAIAYSLNKDKQFTQKLDIESYYGKLENGTYRVVKPVYDNGNIEIYSNAFEIQ